MAIRKKLIRTYLSEDFLFKTILNADHTQLDGCCAATVLYGFAEDSELRDRALEVNSEMQSYDPEWEPDPTRHLPTLKDAQAYIRGLDGTLLLATTHDRNQTLAARALSQLGFHAAQFFRGKTGAPLTLWIYEKPRRRK